MAQRVAVDVAGHVLVHLALQELRDAARELHDLGAALHLAAGVVQRLAVLARDQLRDLAGVLLEQVPEAEQDARAPRRRGLGPGAERALRGLHRAVHLGRRRERHPCLHPAAGRVVHVAEAVAAAGRARTVDVVGQGRGGSGHAAPPGTGARGGTTDEASQKLRSTLSQAQSVAPVRYEEYRPRGSRWLIEHSRVGDDYIFQLHPLKPPTISWQDILSLAITAMDVIFPRSLKIQYVPPSQRYQLKFFTVKVNKVAGLPGWDAAIERALKSLSSIDAWTHQ